MEDKKNNKARLSFFNLGNAQIETLKSLKIAKAMWDTLRSMYDIKTKHQLLF
jgi:hypothetical protein